MKRQITFRLALTAFLLIILLLTGVLAFAPGLQGGVGNFGGIHATCTECPTAVPVLRVSQPRTSAAGNLLELRKSSNTPVAQVYGGGGANLHVPTAVATAVPGLVIDTAHLGNALEIRRNATPVFVVSNTGVFSQAVNAENVGNLPTILTTAITYTAAAGGSGVVATIADGEIWFVHDVFIQVTDDFDTTGDDATLIIGDGGDADGFLVAADANLQAAFTEATGYAAGWYGIENGSNGAYTVDDGGPFVYAPSGSAETIDWVIDETSGETLTAGAATIYIIYTRIR